MNIRLDTLFLCFISLAIISGASGSLPPCKKDSLLTVLNSMRSMIGNPPAMYSPSSRPNYGTDTPSRKVKKLTLIHCDSSAMDIGTIFINRLQKYCPVGRKEQQHGKHIVRMVLEPDVTIHDIKLNHKPNVDHVCTTGTVKMSFPNNPREDSSGIMVPCSYFSSKGNYCRPNYHVVDEYTDEQPRTTSSLQEGITHDVPSTDKDEGHPQRPSNGFSTSPIHGQYQIRPRNRSQGKTNRLMNGASNSRPHGQSVLRPKNQQSSRSRGQWKKTRNRHLNNGLTSGQLNVPLPIQTSNGHTVSNGGVPTTGKSDGGPFSQSPGESTEQSTERLSENAVDTSTGPTTENAIEQSSSVLNELSREEPNDVRIAQSDHHHHQSVVHRNGQSNVQSIEQSDSQSDIQSDSQSDLQLDGQSYDQANCHSNAPSIAQSNGQSDIQSDSQSDLQLDGQSYDQANRQSDAPPISQSNLQLNCQTITQSNGQSNTQPNGQTNLQPNGQSNTQPNGQTNLQPNGQSNTQPNGQTNLQPNGQSNTQPNGQTNLQPNGQSNGKYNRKMHRKQKAHTNLQQPNPQSNAQSNQQSPGASLNAGACVFEKVSLDVHNYFRRIHNTPALQLNEKMCADAQAYAQKIANKGIMEHASSEERNRHGENLAYRCASGNNIVDAVDSVVRWYGEVCDYNYDFSREATGNTLHFTQVVWGKSTQYGVGYGLTKKGSMDCIYVVARYSEAGNMRGDFLQNVLQGSFTPSMCKTYKNDVVNNLNIKCSTYTSITGNTG